MASEIQAAPVSDAIPEFEHEKFEPTTPLGQAIVQVLEPLASLKITVALFAMAIFLILAGTLAQVERDIWDVMGRYFRTWFAWIELQVFFPPAFFHSRPKVPGGFYFPGGWIIGGGMMVNLLAAHGLRFKPQAKGNRLWSGAAVILFGIACGAFVILSGDNKDGLQDVPLFEWSTLWQILKWSLAATAACCVYAAVRTPAEQRVVRWLLISGGTLLGCLGLWTFYRGDDVMLSDSSLRVTWQMIKGLLAGIVLLIGCIMVFKKRAGVVVLHAGILMLLANELVVHMLHEEAIMQIEEGATVNFAQDIRKIELAVVDPSEPDSDDVTVVPQSVLLAEGKIAHEELPFDLKVEKFHKNSIIPPVKQPGDDLATAGIGLQKTAVETKPSTGTDSDSKTDYSSAYVTLFKKGSNEKLGTHLVSCLLDAPDRVEVDGKPYDISLRFKRIYKPYSMHLKEVRADKYMGTMITRNFSSELQLVDPSRGVTGRPIKIWMNNPLRYAGETFYQSSVFPPEGEPTLTGLQVVNNFGWMIPYVACMIVAIGMLTHFVITLARFLNRRARAPDSLSSKEQKRLARESRESQGVEGWLVPLAVVLLAAVVVLGRARTPAIPEGEPNLEAFGRLPLMYEGRHKPFDTLARNSLRVISDSESYTDADGNTQPAIRWLLDVIARPTEAAKHKVVRIQNLEVQTKLGLERRPGFRYAIDEFQEKMQGFEDDAREAHKKQRAKEELSVYDRKVLELDNRLRMYMLLMTAFDQPRIRQDNAMEDLMRVIQRQRDTFPEMQLPLAVPPEGEQTEWEPYAQAYVRAWVAANVPSLKESPRDATLAMNAVLVSYAKGETGEFNKELAAYIEWLASHPPRDLSPRKIEFEAFFNHFRPFFLATWLYFAAFVLVALSWLFWQKPLGRAAVALILFTGVLHLLALVGRIYISGRPPVTNLYSSAVFIGFGAVVLGMLLELIYKQGIGSAVAAIVGFSTLTIADKLAGDGKDTFTVLQAVLDTQFWLATHVTCITLGYATTYVAGLLGEMYILGSLFTTKVKGNVAKDMSRMLYGTLCFSIFFSFVGTVLGGLWADDSWGRFWGWDPKENGALIIVLWNALVLHARWDGLVKERGMAVLAVLGNIAVSWSWFGVNELGAGLHSYGFTEGVIQKLALFALSQLVVAGLGLVPQPNWKSALLEPKDVKRS